MLSSIQRFVELPWEVAKDIMQSYFFVFFITLVFLTLSACAYWGLTFAYHAVDGSLLSILLFVWALLICTAAFLGTLLVVAIFTMPSTFRFKMPEESK